MKQPVRWTGWVEHQLPQPATRHDTPAKPKNKPRPPPAGPGTPIDVLGLSVRPYNALMRAGIKTVQQLAALKPYEVLTIRNVGELAGEEITTKLAAHLETAWPPTIPATAPEPPAADAQMPLEALGLSPRAYHAAYRAGIRTVGQLAATPDDVLLGSDQIGPITLRELRDKLSDFVCRNPTVAAEPAALAEAASAEGESHPVERQERWRSLANDRTPLASLELSHGAFWALFQAGIKTVGELAALSRDELKLIRNLNPKSMARIEAELAAHESRTSAGASPHPKAGSDPLLHAVSIARLGLPREANALLGAAGLHMIGQLVDDPARNFYPAAVQQAVSDYLGWWNEQPADARGAEVTATGPGSLKRDETPGQETVAALIDAALEFLDDRSRQVVRLRFGLDGPVQNLEAIGKRFGVTRERIRQIERKAIKGLKRRYYTPAYRPLANFVALLRHELVLHERGWALDACSDWLQSNDKIRLGPIQLLGLLTLLCQLDDRLVLWPKHGVIALAGVLPETPHRPRPSRKRSAISEVPPSNDWSGIQAVAENTRVPENAREPIRSAKVAAWPNLWPDRWRDHDSFMGFLTYANELLGRLPTVAAWTDDLLGWAHRSPNRSVDYRQRLLDCTYIVGLIDRVEYVAHADQRLAPALAAPLAAAALRDHSIRSALARLEGAAALLERIVGQESFRLETVLPGLGLDEATAAGHLRLFYLLGLIWGGPDYRPRSRAASFLGQATAPPPAPRPTLQPHVPPARPPARARAPRAKETQSQLLLRALEASGRPAHVSEILARAAELTRGTTLPKQSVALLLLLQSNERAAISLGEGVFSLTEWEAARASQSRPTLPICPRPWVDVRAFHERLLESVFAAAEELRDEPTAAEFQARMLAWWGVDTGARLWVRQSMLSAYYLLGVVPFAFAGDSQRPLRAELPPLGVAGARDHCRRALGERLAAMPDWLDTLRRLGPARPKELAAAFAPLHPYGLNDVEARLHLLAGLGAAERLSDGTYRLIALDGAAHGQVAVVGADADDAPSGRLRACPALLPDRPGEGHTFLESVVQAGKVLDRGPTVDQFLREMIAWAGSDYPKSETYYQNILDAYYVVGLIDRTSYARQRRAILRSTLPPVEDTAALRDHCIRAALDRLEHGRRLLETAARLQPFTRKEMQEALGFTLDNAVRHLRLFTNLGILSHDGLEYRLIGNVSNETSVHHTSYKIHVPEHTFQERGRTTYGEDGLELLAYLSGIE